MSLINLNYRESKDFFTQEEINIINQDVLGNTFPWYIHPNPTTDKYFFMSHILIKRDDEKINSSVFSFFNIILERFLKEHNLKYKKITRACIKLTFSDKRFIYSDPHVDYSTPHSVCIMYLNNTKGDTYIFDEPFKGGPTVFPVENIKELKVLKQIKPEQGKVIYYNGLYYHANSFCDEGKYRVLLVITFV